MRSFYTIHEDYLKTNASSGNTLRNIRLFKNEYFLNEYIFEKRILSLRIHFGKRITCDRILLNFTGKNEYFENSKNE